ncbi:hypothetical protein [Thermococcus sp.]|uniref:hypothetical protein n=1 Tax=Thermococcus sp. TaxID=35749 RepID=UPI0025DDFA76|nr:hypothetical protein [Thermococcus sp.]
MADVSVRGFAIIVLSILIIVHPPGWFSALVTAILFAGVGWTVIVIANEIDALRSEIWKLHHEIRTLRKELGTVE